MVVRRPCAAGGFYPSGKETCRRKVESCFKGLGEMDISKLPDKIVAGIVPHAGWIFSGPTAARVYKVVELKEKPETFILFGAVHVPGVNQPSIWIGDAWETPLGEIEVDQKIVSQLLAKKSSIIQENSLGHTEEHSIEVQIPFIQYLFPKAKIVAIMVPPSSNATKVGELVAEVCGEGSVVIGSTDLTHYGSYPYGFAPKGEGEEALNWVKEVNDREMIDMIMSLKGDSIVKEAGTKHNACGGGAVAATVAFAKARHCEKGHLLQYVTSHDVYPERNISRFVGYAGIVF